VEGWKGGKDAGFPYAGICMTGEFLDVAHLIMPPLLRSWNKANHGVLLMRSNCDPFISCLLILVGGVCLTLHVHC
jgi:hypothetical protein